MQESFSDLGEAFGTLNDERVKNLIPIPGGKQVRAHHSIPAAPRHNIGNLEKQRNHNVGYQMKKMAEGISLFNQVGNSSTMNNSLERIPKPESKQNTAHRKNNKQFSDFKPKNKKELIRKERMAYFLRLEHVFESMRRMRHEIMRSPPKYA